MLVIVLGTLALIAVIAVVYAVVGQADRRASAAFVGSVRREEMPTLVRDYIAGIVGRDALATYRDGAGDLKREAFDYPFTDPYARSVVVGSSGAPNSPTVPAAEEIAQTFDPAGSYWSVSQYTGNLAGVFARGSLGNTLELRVPGDPWLAATQASNLTINDDEPDGGYPQANMRDWAHISNVSPDGRFVNLWNLRNNFGSVSGFNVADRDISSRLTLYGDTGLPFTATGNQQLLSGGNASLNTPAHWTNDQRAAFRPASGMPTIDWSQAENPLYQWADADGDGFFDSRWFEFVDISGGLNAAVNIFPPDQSGIRWFGAVRVVDLSAAINLNTATDFLASPAVPPGPTPPYAAPGLTPADVDLRRLLTGEDVRELAAGVGYDGMRQPLNSGGGVDDASAQYTGLMAGDLGTPGWELSQYVGDAAYNHLRYFLDFGLIAPATARLINDQHEPFINYVNQQHQSPTLASGQGLAEVNLFRYTRIGDRRDWYDIALGVDPNSPPGSPVPYSVSQFTIESEGELLTYRGANNPFFTSTVELVLDGRFDNGNGANAQTGSFEYGPMRSTRGLTVEVAQRDRVNGLITPPGQPGALNPDGVADLDALTQVLTDLRQHVTTVSASRPLRNALTSASQSSPAPALGTGDQLRASSAASGSARTLFGVYADALLPYSGIEETWDTGAQEFMTLSYGYAGSEVALVHAAHLAVNMKDAADSDSDPSFATVIVDESVRDDLNADYDPPPPSGQNPTGTVATQAIGSRQNKWAAWVDGGNFDLGASRLADTNGGITSPINVAFNVYGAEPQPFIAEVSAMILYTDAPTTVTGATQEPNDTFVTINGTRAAGNPDLAFQAIAFQITNPFATSLTIGADATTDESRYYIEYGGRFFRIPTVDPDNTGWTGTLGAHETRTFYVAARDAAGDKARWDQYVTTGSTQFAPFLGQMMGVDAATGSGGGRTLPPVRLIEFNPLTGATVQSSRNGYNDVFVSTTTPPTGLAGRVTTDEVRLWRTTLASGQTTANDPAEEYATNALDNDILADRFRIPAATQGRQEVLKPLLALTGDEVQDAWVNPSVPGLTNYDTGLSVVLWGTVRRPSDPEATGIPVQEVVWLPAYCLEPKAAPTAFKTSAVDGVSPQPDVVEFEGTSNELATTFNDILNKITGGSIIQTLNTHPHDKTGADIGVNLAGVAWSELLAEFHNGVGSTGGRRLTPSDLLIPKGTGASLMLGSSLSFNPNTNTELATKWTTLGEATCRALDYNRGTAGTDVLWAPGRPPSAPGDIDGGSLTLGHLKIDDYVPFYDSSPDGAPFDPSDDIAYGEAMPLALGVMAQYRVQNDTYGTFRRATPGLININTAPLAVLRALPMLSPTHGMDPSIPGSAPGDAWLAFENGSSTGQGPDSDVASTLLAYRDLLTIFPRADLSGSISAPDDVVDFAFNTRADVASVPGLRQTPGFRSVAEVLNARTVIPVPPGTPRPANLHNIDRLGFDGDPVEQHGFDPVVYPNNTIDPMTDEFDERFVLAGALSGCVTVRSDVYAAWFVLHGYRESDCTGLGSDDPLFPSVSRRFLMVIDRSSVVQPGDTPNILLFREVPYSPTDAGDGSAT